MFPRSAGSRPQALTSATQHQARQIHNEPKIKKVHPRKSPETTRNQRNRSHRRNIPDPNSGRNLDTPSSPKRLRYRASLKSRDFRYSKYHKLLTPAPFAAVLPQEACAQRDGASRRQRAVAARLQFTERYPGIRLHQGENGSVIPP